MAHNVGPPFDELVVPCADSLDREWFDEGRQFDGPCHAFPGEWFNVAGGITNNEEAMTGRSLQFARERFGAEPFRVFEGLGRSEPRLLDDVTDDCAGG